jgi:hypothetical protein
MIPICGGSMMNEMTRDERLLKLEARFQAAFATRHSR